MLSEGHAREPLVDAIMLSYGVAVIWIDRFEEAESILKRVYISAEGVIADDWDRLQRYLR